MKITVTNPWSGATLEKQVCEVMNSIEVFAAVEECEKVNDVFSGTWDIEWIECFRSIHGENRLSEIAFS